MSYKYILLSLLMVFGMTSQVSAQKRASANKKAKPTVNADSVEVRKLIETHWEPITMLARK